MKESLPLPSTMMTQCSLRPSPYFATMSSFNRCLPASPYHIYPYRLQRPLTPPCPLPALPSLTCCWIEDLTDSWELSPGITLPTFSTQFSSPSQRSSAELTMVVSRWRRRHHSNLRAGYPNQELLNPDPLGTPPSPTPYPLLTALSILSPSWLDEPTPFLVAQEQCLPPPQENDIAAMLLRLNEVGEGLADEVLLELAWDALCSPEDWRWLWNPEPATTPFLSLTLLSQTTLLYNVSNASPWNTYTPNVLNISAPSAEEPPLDILNTPAPCILAQSVGSSVMWAPVAQPQPLLPLPLSLPEWATSEDFESVPQGYEGGNVTVEEAPTSFSPFPLVDCTLLSHFSFNDFVAVAFPDLAKDLDSPI